MDRDIRIRAAHRRLLDSLTRRVNIPEMNGESYRLSQSRSHNNKVTQLSNYLQICPYGPMRLGSRQLFGKPTHQDANPNQHR